MLKHSINVWQPHISWAAGELIQLFYSLCLVFALLTACYGELRWFHSHGFRVISPDNAFIGLLIFLVLGAGALLCSKLLPAAPAERWKLPFYWLSNLRFNPYAFVAGLVILLASDFVERRFGFYVGPGVRTEALYAGILAAVLVLCASRNAKTVQCISWPLLIGAQVVCAVLFLQYADGRLLFSDDHPSFLYRLLMLRENFPHIPYYNTDWNGGYSAREFYPSGVINVFLLAAPFIYWFDASSPFEYAVRYTYLIPYLFMGIVPVSVYLGGRVMGFGRQSALLAALFSLGPSLGYLEWLLKYGTLGFALSAALVPLTYALSYRLALDERPPKWVHVISLFAAASLCLRWTLSIVVFLPAVIAALIFIKRTLSVERRAKVFVFIAAFLICNGSWMATFVAESKVLSFISGAALPGTADAAVEGPADSGRSEYRRQAKEIAGELKDFRRAVVKVNPLLIMLCVPGLLFVRSALLRWLFVSTIGFLGFTAVIGNWLKPQLELHRMIIPISFLCVLLAGLAVFSLAQELLAVWRSDSRSKLTQASAMLLFVVLFGAAAISPVTIAAAYQNRSDEKYVFAPAEAETLSNAIAQHGGDGRTFFLGFILHELGARDYRTQDGGHIAPLPFFSGKELYASHYYHRYWTSIDPIPGSYRARGEQGIEEFLDLVNATAVITFKREWVQYCQARPWYRQVFRQGRFRLFVRERDTGGFVMKGEGEVSRAARGLTIRSSSPEIVVKYRYLPKLKVRSADADVEMFSVAVFDEDVGKKKQEQVSYIGLRVKSGSPSEWTAEVGYP